MLGSICAFMASTWGKLLFAPVLGAGMAAAFGVLAVMGGGGSGWGGCFAPGVICVVSVVSTFICALLASAAFRAW